MFRVINRAIYWLFHSPRVFVINVLCNYLTWLPDKLFVKLHFRLETGYPLNLEDPKTFCEKLQWLKFNDIHEEYTQMVDKVTAKKYVASIIGKEYIIPTLGVWDSVDEIEWEALPNQFVVKPTNDSGGLVICRDKATFDVEAAKARLRYYGKRDYSRVNKEYPYKKVPHRFIAEEYKEDESGELRDYKFFCFNGRAEYCQIIQGRSSEMTIDFYDRDWQHQPFNGLGVYPHSAVAIPKPLNYEKMVELSSLLATGIPFVRVDLYNVNGKIYFGELTFFPMSGYAGFYPKEWDSKLGECICLP